MVTKSSIKTFSKAKVASVFDFFLLWGTFYHCGKFTVLKPG
jgi:hypothetical protein